MDFDFDSLEFLEPGQEIKPVITEDERHYLYRVLYESTYDNRQIEWLIVQIKYCEDTDEFVKLRKAILMNRIERKDRCAMGFTYNIGDLNLALLEMKKQYSRIELKKI